MFNVNGELVMLKKERKLKMKKWLLSVLTSVFIVGLLAACGNDGSDSNTVRIGYFPNLTHIATIVALEQNYFEEEFGEGIEISTETVSNGGLFMEAMATDAIDVGTVGPGPLLNF